MIVAALYVDPCGVYSNLAGVSCWGLPDRDAREYAGPWPVVAHPPCERWGRYWHGGPSARVRRRLGDDGGCFAAALAAARRWGGVIEHPEASHAWRAHGLNAPPRWGGWVVADFEGDWTCCVEQGHYGHRARKATWLYAHGVELPSLVWGPSSSSVRLDAGYHTAAERRAGKARGEQRDGGRLTKKEASATPPAFRDADRDGPERTAEHPLPPLRHPHGPRGSRLGRLAHAAADPGVPGLLARSGDGSMTRTIRRLLTLAATLLAARRRARSVEGQGQRVADTWRTS